MYDLLTRTISQGLQAFLPIAFGLAWFRRTGETNAAAGLRWGIAAAVPATLAAVYGFQRSNRQSAWEAALAAVALLLAIWFVLRLRSGIPGSTIDEGVRANGVLRLAVAVGATIMIVRQTMEIGVTLWAALEQRAQDPLVAILAGAAVSLAAGLVWVGLGSRLPDAALRRTTRLFAVLFVAQAAMYVFHESAEAGLLPWSDVLHAATEPYGPDGAYGRYVSAALFVVPLATAVPMLLSTDRRRGRGMVSGATVVAAVVLVIGIEVMTLVGDRATTYPRPSASSPRADVATLTAAPHLLFRHTAADQNYRRLSIAPVDAPGATARAAAGVGCERVAYAAGHGICLTAERGLFTSYKAVLFDHALNPTRTIRLAGSPSRTRVSPDGRVGAITVFAIGSAHTYKGSAFSTKTTILDMATGEELGDLEQFTAWRNGTRLAAADFNFWGVTFARDSNIFYATLRTGGTTYLVRGELALRKLTILHENVECPSLSPDNRRIAFKKRIGPVDEPWRFYVLDLATLTEHPIAAERRSIDDQLEWLDDTHVLYAAPRSNGAAGLDVWVALVDEGAPARVFLADAESPIVVRD